MTGAGRESTDASLATKSSKTFDPNQYLVNLNGKGEYLEVKFRLLWIRTVHPDAVIETEIYRLEDREAVFKARVSIPGGGSATGWGTESAGDFRDFVEKAETKAIGRALAALGFGTQFCQDHDFGVGDVVPQRVDVANMRIVDAPVDLSAPRRRAESAPGRPAQTNGNGNGGGTGDQPATERQLKFVPALAREVGLDEEELATWCTELYNKSLHQLNRRDASALIEALQRRRQEVL